MDSNSVLEQHPDLYFADGDVVLSVKQTAQSSEGPPKHTLFRVHKFLLKHHSAAFANVFADANAALTEVYDGVPLAEMYGDNAEDFALLLGYLYNPSSLVFKRHDPNTPLAVSGVVRLADKYLIEPLHRRLVQQVCEDWPTTLAEYDIQEAEIDSLRKMRAAGFEGSGRLSDIVPEPASAIMFALEFGCTQILPAAFYRLSRIPVAWDWRAPPSWREGLVARWSVLDKENLMRYIHGCQQLSLYRPGSAVDDFLCDACADSALGEEETHPCYQFIQRLFEINWEEGGPSSTHRDPLRLLEECRTYHEFPELSKDQFPNGLCRGCDRTLRIALAEERKKIWQKLPNWFKFE